MKTLTRIIAALALAAATLVVGFAPAHADDTAPTPDCATALATLTTQFNDQHEQLVTAWASLRTTRGLMLRQQDELARRFATIESLTVTLRDTRAQAADREQRLQDRIRRLRNRLHKLRH